MSALINFEIDANFWKVNPSFLAVKGFRAFYDNDNDRTKRKSSDLMWAIALYSDQTQYNVFRNINSKERIELVEESTGIKIDPEEHKEFITLYQKLTLNAFERSMLSFLKKLEEREEFILSTPYDLKNARDLDQILSNTKLLHDLYQKLVDDIEKYKNQSGGVTRGNIQESAGELGLM